MAAKYILTAPPTHSLGITLGESATDKAGLFGAAVVQPLGAAQAAVDATALTGAAGANPTQAEYATVVAKVNSLVTLTNKLRADLVTLGALKGSA